VVAVDALWFENEATYRKSKTISSNCDNPLPVKSKMANAAQIGHVKNRLNLISRRLSGSAKIWCVCVCELRSPQLVAHVLNLYAGALWAPKLKPRTTGATSDGLKLQCIAIATFSSCRCCCCKADWHDAAVSTDDDWPSRGHVTFNNYATRYRPGLDLVLNDVCIDISAGEKVYVFPSCRILYFIEICSYSEFLSSLNSHIAFADFAVYDR